MMSDPMSPSAPGSSTPEAGEEKIRRVTSELHGTREKAANNSWWLLILTAVAIPAISVAVVSYAEDMSVGKLVGVFFYSVVYAFAAYYPMREYVRTRLKHAELLAELNRLELDRRR